MILNNIWLSFNISLYKELFFLLAFTIIIIVAAVAVEEVVEILAIVEGFYEASVKLLPVHSLMKLIYLGLFIRMKPVVMPSQ